MWWKVDILESEKNVWMRWKIELNMQIIIKKNSVDFSRKF